MDIGSAGFGALMAAIGALSAAAGLLFTSGLRYGKLEQRLTAIEREIAPLSTAAKETHAHGIVILNLTKTLDSIEKKVDMLLEHYYRDHPSPSRGRPDPK